MGSKSARPGAATLIDLNQASLEELAGIPNIGVERARQVIAMRPLNSLQLPAIDGIGPKRLGQLWREVRLD